MLTRSGTLFLLAGLWFCACGCYRTGNNREPFIRALIFKHQRLSIFPCLYMSAYAKIKRSFNYTIHVGELDRCDNLISIFPQLLTLFPLHTQPCTCRAWALLLRCPCVQGKVEIGNFRYELGVFLIYMLYRIAYYHSRDNRLFYCLHFERNRQSRSDYKVVSEN